MSGNTEEALEVLRAVWSAQEQRAEDVEEDCGPVKACKRMTDVGFDGLAGRPTATCGSPGGPSWPARAS